MQNLKQKKPKMLFKTTEKYKCTNQTKYNIENEHTIKQIKHWLYSSNEN